MEDFKVRLLAERDQLKDRLEKLNIFLATDKFKELDSAMQNLMVSQSEYMTGYLNVLEKRIKLLNI